MRLRVSLGLLAALLTCSAPHAQVSITSANLYPFVPNQPATFDNFATSGGTVPPADQARIDALIALRGPNQTWDFTAITYPEQIGTTLTYFTNLASVPGASNFPTANVALGAAFTLAGPGPGGTSYTFARTTASAYTAIGFYIPGSPASGNVETLNTYDAGGLTQFTFPFTAGTTVTDETVVTASSPPPSQTFTLGETRTVLGYGTLVTPQGSAPCLMYREESRQSMGGTVLSTIIRYFWRTPSESIGAVATNQEFTPGTPAYSVYHSVLRSGGTASEGNPSVSPTLALSAAPNPVRGSSSVRVLAAAPLDAVVTVTDALGREVARLHDGPLAPGEHAFALDASRLAPGVYVVRVQAGGESVSARLSVVR